MPSQMIRSRSIAACLALAMGCAARDVRPASAPRTHWVSGYFFGLLGQAELDVRDDCPKNGARDVRIGGTWSTIAVSLLTLGLYTPREVRLTCQAE